MIKVYTTLCCKDEKEITKSGFVVKTQLAPFYVYGAENFIQWDILNPDRLINLEINNKRKTSII